MNRNKKVSKLVQLLGECLDTTLSLSESDFTKHLLIMSLKIKDLV
ncbi:hypothetical protein [Streptococcus sciuri]|uniref:Uncharacterized protein n=1 Tax=Streptococcus sciuri TaxID=2973939 RepID=A0ABT2F7R5_9STRE|nr:hypothetical protein [Streptococcus sciuri]MCS4488066.1 hypothetical protein [Streptococcus sciuri]